MEPLSKAEVHKRMALLSEEQQAFLLKATKQSKKSKWLEVLAKKKGFAVKQDMPSKEIESMIDDWVLVEILDSGYGNRDYRCECGKPLRYQYVVLNKKQGKTYGLGVTCFENHTNLPSEVVKDILSGFHKIDLERDEILMKIGWDTFDITPYLHVEGVPPEYVEQAQLGLPLTDKQIFHLEDLKKIHDMNERQKMLLQALKPEAKEFLRDSPENIQREIMTKIENDSYFRVLPDGFHDEEIEKFLSLGLPLLDKQLKQIFAYNQSQKRDGELEWRRREAEILQDIDGDASYFFASVYQPSIQQVEPITYQILLDLHLSTLQKVREKEDMLSRGMKNDWERVQQMVRQLKSGQDFDYSSFKVNLEMICISLKI